MTKRSGNTSEILLNGVFADLLRQRGLEAEAEQSLKDSKGKRHQVDILVELDENAVAIEAEFAPARTVQSDARKRVSGDCLYWRGLPVTCVFTVVYPASLKSVPESQAKKKLAKCGDLEFSRVMRSDDSLRTPDLFGYSGEQGSSFLHVSDQAGHYIVDQQKQSGSVGALSDMLHNFWIRAESGTGIEETVQETSIAITRASEILRNAPDLDLNIDEDSDPAATSALIWLNALLFQELLAQNLAPSALPPRHRGKRIPRPDPDGSPNTLVKQWDAILEINWWPIFYIARESLSKTPSLNAKRALRELQRVSSTIAERGVIRRHDIAGRIFHRLLNTRKFLATNYTTIPAAVLLAGLALDREHPHWKTIDWGELSALSQLRVTDPACGSGTLLMAFLQEALKLHRRATGDSETQKDATRILLEEAIHGYDVVPAAIHLTAATLSMAETRQIIDNMPLYWMPHDVDNRRARLGSLDFLKKSPGKGRAQFLPLFPGKTAPARRTGKGKRKHDATMPENCDLIIANPPYTRAGGPGSSENTAWNPIFGSLLSKAHTNQMTQALRKTLDGTPASLYAGLGSAFLTLADERLGVGGRLAFVLPATALTGSRWAPIRKMLLEKYHVEWVVVSHDDRNRTARQGLPGRRYVAFSESTRIAETLIVGTKKQRHEEQRGQTRFVNLRRNPDEPIEAMAVTRALLASTPGRVEVVVGEKIWGEASSVKQSDLDEAPWSHATFVQGRLTEAALALRDNGELKVGRQILSVPTVRLEKVCELGPYHMQIKNPNHGLFDIIETEDPTRSGHPALWHHKEDRVTALETNANARLRARKDRDQKDQKSMLKRQGHLHIAGELGHAPQRLAAVLTDEPMLGVRSWITLVFKMPVAGNEESLCLWLNSTPGLLLRIIHANRPYLGRSGLPHELARSLPVLDVNKLTATQRRAARRVFKDLKRKPLQGFAHIATDPVRRELDHRLFKEVLGCDAATTLDKLARTLNREPTLTTRH